MNYRAHLKLMQTLESIMPDAGKPKTNLEKLQNAARLIEDTTGCRFTVGIGGAFIYPDESAYLTVNMRTKTDYAAGLYRIRFDVNIRTMGHPMNADGLSRLLDEVSCAHRMLTTLETQEYILTPEENQQFTDYIRQREEQAQSDGPVMDMT